MFATESEPRYPQLLATHPQMHREGDAQHNIAAGEMFPGQSRPLKVTVKGARSFISIPEFRDATVHCNDPAYPPHMALPAGRFLADGWAGIRFDGEALAPRA